MRVVATAGHVDHGKSTLVRAITGTDPDRLAEEKLRGLTIDLGFAHTVLPSGDEVAFVDVPGHVRFIKNMLAGVGAVDACLFVVAATEGWKPQSEEHLRILSLLDVPAGVIALTKADLVDGDHLGLVALDIADRVAGTFLEGAAVVPVDGLSGRGLEGLVGALGDLVATTPGSADRGWPRLWIDRVFPVRGAGTVVTGTLTGGSFTVDEVVAVEPGATRARIRRLHSHQVEMETAGPGRRVAINLAGVGHDEVARGQAVVRPGQWHRSAMVDASLTVLASLDHDVARRGAYAAYVGSGEFPVRVRVLGRDGRIEPGRTGFVRLWLTDVLPLLPGDRYVLRESGRSETVGGGEILDVAPVLPASRAAPSRDVGRLVAERGWVDAGELTRLVGTPTSPTVGRWVVHPETLATARAALVTRLAEAGPSGLDLALLDDRERALLDAGIGGVTVSAGRAVPATTSIEAGEPGGPPLSPAAREALATLLADPWAPATPPDRGALRELARAGLAVEAGGAWFAASAVTAAAGAIAAVLARHPGGATVSDIRDALRSSRKHVLPLLAHLDATGVTRRRGDLRIAGPRAPAPPS